MTMSNIDPNDPILTAYALGELDAADAARVEAMLADDETASRLIEEIRATASGLEAMLSAEPLPALHETQRAYIAARIEPTVEVPPLRLHRVMWWTGGVGALAACLVAAFVWLGNPWDRGHDTFVHSGPGAASRELATDAEADALGQARGALKSGDQSLRGQLHEEMPLGMADADGPGRGGQLREFAAESMTPPAGVARGRSDESPRAAGGGGGRGESDSGMPARLPMPPPSSAAPRRLNEPAPASEQGESFGIDLDRFDRERANAVHDNREEFNRENYREIIENPFIAPRGEQALSTFSIDVDTASYTNVRRFLQSGRRPPRDAVRIEELLNYFRYDDPAPTDEHPFAATLEVGPAPWKPAHRLVRLGLRGVEIDVENRPPTNLVFLIDVSGSMNEPSKLPLLKRSMKLLVDQLTPDDRVALVVYAGRAGLVLPSTYAFHKDRIVAALDSLQAGGSTNGGQGIQLAYNVAQENFIEGGVNRVILATDGDFNVGVSSDGDLHRLIESKRASGIFLSVLGFGMGNLQDAKMELLANKGNGHYAYIDSLDEARRVLVEEMGGTLVTIAKDVKVQVEFNPAKVAAYRLIGYENRLLAARDFNDDAKDAGELGAGMSITALYEVVPIGVEIDVPQVDDLKYQRPARGDEGGEGEEARAEMSDELLTLKLRYKRPDEETSRLMQFPLRDGGGVLEATSADFRFAASVASFGMLLRESAHRGESTFTLVRSLAKEALGEDVGGYRRAFLELVDKAEEIIDTKRE